MSLRNLSNFSSSMPSQPTASPMSLGGGKGMAGSQRSQANPQSQMLQQLMQMMMARRQSGMQNPGFMSPLQRMGGVMPQLPSQAAPQAVQAVQGNTPEMQAQQAAQTAAQTPVAPPTPSPAPTTPMITDRTHSDLLGTNATYGGRPVYLRNGQYVYDAPGFGGDTWGNWTPVKLSDLKF